MCHRIAYKDCRVLLFAYLHETVLKPMKHLLCDFKSLFSDGVVYISSFKWFDWPLFPIFIYNQGPI